MTDESTPQGEEQDKMEENRGKTAEENQDVLSDSELDQIVGGAVSNVMKTRHDTAMNSISNVR